MMNSWRRMFAVGVVLVCVAFDVAEANDAPRVGDTVREAAPPDDGTDAARWAQEAYPSPYYVEPSSPRVFFDVSVGIARPDASEFSNFVTYPFRSETFRADALYAVPRGAVFEVGGGVMLTKAFGLGLTLSGSAYQPDVFVRVSIPDIFAFNNDAVATGTLIELERTEGAVHFQGVLALDASDAVSLRLSAGPSYFRLKQDLVYDVTYSESFLPHRAEIRTLPTASYDGSGWGFHAGADLAFYFTRSAGIGVLVRYAKGTVTQPVALGERVVDQTFDYPVGGLHAGAGLRLRF